MATIHYMSKAIANFDSLVDEPFDLESPSRSTVPLLAYWADFDARLVDFGGLLKLPIPNDSLLTFERTVWPTKGRGNASHTDLMIQSPSVVIATEAKYTEGKYPTVSQWLGTPAESNKLLVLDGWLETINRATGSNLEKDQVLGITYQLIHRTASACTPAAEKRAVVLHYFDPIEEMAKHYKTQLTALSQLIASPRTLALILYITTLRKTAAYADLQSEWLANKKPDMSSSVRRLLHERNVASFNEPQLLKL